ncbi:MAG: hypothetical protein Q8J89_13975 [Caulobacter sp.]|nr:hypothetical protein [Caulobacter sp.]
MRIITAAIIAATAVSGLTATAATAATAAFAAEGRLSDSQLIKAYRCAGLAGADADKFNAVIKANKRGRADFVLDKALNARNDAARQVRSAREGGKAEIAAELAGVCAALVA